MGRAGASRESRLRPRDDDELVASFRLSAPSEAADELVAEGVAIVADDVRGIGDVTRILIDGVNTAASVVTVSSATVYLRRASQRLAQHLRNRRGGQPVDVVIQGPHGERKLRIDPASPIDEAAQALEAALIAVRSSRNKPAS